MCNNDLRDKTGDRDAHEEAIMRARGQRTVALPQVVTEGMVRSGLTGEVSKI